MDCMALFPWIGWLRHHGIFKGIDGRNTPRKSKHYFIYSLKIFYIKKELGFFCGFKMLSRKKTENGRFISR